MIAYFDCFSGISGDMTLGAFIDLGVDVRWLENTLAALPLSGFELSVSDVLRRGLGAKKVTVHLKSDTAARNYAEIRSLIEKSPFSDKVKEIGLKIFDRLADVESAIHRQPKEKVHFHEIGGVDAIVDIVGTALCMESLGISRVISSTIPLGKGTVLCHHGKLPLPAPATLELLKDVPVYGVDVSHELVTPTGAAIITSLAERFGAMPDMIVKKTGYGAGERDPEATPNLMRITTGTIPYLGLGMQDQEAVMVETCIDDMNPEIFGFLMERLFEEGALDVFWIPAFMKKNRPGTLVKVLCDRITLDRVIRRILSETSSIGVRYYPVERRVLERELVHADTSYGRVQVKRITDPSLGTRMVPEYEVCRKIALEKNIPFKVVYDTIAMEVKTE